MATLSERLRRSAAGTGVAATHDMRLHDEAANALDAMEAALVEARELILWEGMEVPDSITNALAMVRK